jgi:gluconolactonase
MAAEPLVAARPLDEVPDLGRGWDVVCEGLGFPEGPVSLDDGRVLVTDLLAGTIVEVSSGVPVVVADCGGAPNGAAIGRDGALYVCNNGGHSWRRGDDGITFPGPPAASDYDGGRIERVDLATGAVARVADHCGNTALTAPNDIVSAADGTLYFTDTGKTLGDHRMLGGLYRLDPARSTVTSVVFPLDRPNGVGLSPDGAWLYASETWCARLWRWPTSGRAAIDDRETPGGADLVIGLGGFSGFDSLAVRGDGTVWVATLVHGVVLAVEPNGLVIGALRPPVPDRYVTNICFDVNDGTRAFVTSGGRGRVYAVTLDDVGPVGLSDEATGGS